MLQKALDLCVTAHRNQMDRDGMPHSFHCIRVSMAQTTDDRMVAALLHDVIEDCGPEYAQVIRFEFGPHICAVVELLTRGEEEPWNGYIRRIMGDEPIRQSFSTAQHMMMKRAREDAMHIKLADIEDNVSPRRLDDKMRKQLPMYHEAYKKIARRLGYTDKVLPL